MDTDISHFQSIPWVSALLRDPAFSNRAIPSRTVKETTEDAFYARTLNSPETIKACLMQYRIPESSSSSTSGSSTTSSPSNVTELRTFFTLGSDMNGYPGTLHGGMVATLVDECTGLLLMARGDVADDTTRSDNNLYSVPVTAYLNTKFRRPVPTPGTIVVYTKLVEASESKRWKIQADIVDHKGCVLATGESLFVRTKAKI
jgi:acyl-coenzyme A thioesterase PaaI-like protein